MDNDYKVSWIDTNPQNSQNRQQYRCSKNKCGKARKEHTLKEDVYDSVYRMNRQSQNYETKDIQQYLKKVVEYITKNRLAGLVHGTVK